MGMCIEVEGKTTYTVHLTNEDVALVKKWIKEHEEDLPSLSKISFINFSLHHHL